MIQAHEEGKHVHLNEIRARISKQYGYSGVPRLVDIISAIPDDFKKALLPNLRARPIRTASGVSTQLLPIYRVLTLWPDSSGRSYVQTAQMPSHRDDWQYMRV